MASLPHCPIKILDRTEDNRKAATRGLGGPKKCCSQTVSKTRRACWSIHMSPERSRQGKWLAAWQLKMGPLSWSWCASIWVCCSMYVWADIHFYYQHSKSPGHIHSENVHMLPQYHPGPLPLIKQNCLATGTAGLKDNGLLISMVFAISFVHSAFFFKRACSLNTCSLANTPINHPTAPPNHPSTQPTWQY